MKARIKNCLKKIKIGGYKLKDTLPPYFSGGFLIISLILTINLLILTANYPPCSNKILGNPIAKADAATPSQAIAQNTIVLVIDGLRNDEAFDDPTHQYIPRIWNDLRPQGTINTNFWNTGITVTTAGHNQIVTGVREFLNNELDGTSKIHAEYPTIFEYYRKQKGIAKDKTWFIAGKGIITSSVNYSLHPDYENLGASRDSIYRDDAATWTSVQQKMDTYHPSLMVVNLRDVDHGGHQGVNTGFAGYTKEIVEADQVAYDLWNKIQNDPYYKDKTDLIITSDHGRNSEGYIEGYFSHGARNHGSRHLMFLALGPDFKQNQIVTERRDQIDIAPTLGAILGVQTPYADGSVMTELFNDSNLGSNIVTGGQRRVSMAASSSGAHTVWSEKNGQEWDIYYKRTNGSTTQSMKLFENSLDNNYFYEAEVTSQGNMVYVAATGYSLINEGGDTYTWKVFGKRSLDGGNTWQSMQELKDVGHFIADPSINSNGNNILITYSSDIGKQTSSADVFHTLNGLMSVNQGASFTDYKIADKEGDSSQVSSAITSDLNNFYVTWTGERSGGGFRYWNVFFDKSYAATPTWSLDKAITANTTNLKMFFSNNAIATNGAGVMRHLSTKRVDIKDADKEFIAGKWKIVLRGSSDYGNTFALGEDFYGSATYEAWNPQICYLAQGGKDFVVLWEQHQNNTNGEIYGRKKVGRTWQAITPLSTLDGKDSVEPVLATYNNNTYAAWQDYGNGRWQIEIKKIN